MFDMTEYNKMIGTVRTDARGLNFKVDQASYSQATKHTPAMVTLSGRVIDNTPQENHPNATWFDAHATEHIIVGATPERPSVSNGALAERNERVKYARTLGVEKPHLLKKDALEAAIAKAEADLPEKCDLCGKPADVCMCDGDPFDDTPELTEDALPEPTTVAEAVALRESVREAWLMDLNTELNGIFRQAGYPQVDETKVLISTGFPVGNARKIIGQCHHASANGGIAHLFISPVLDDSMDVAATLIHEKAHSLGFTGHTGDFRKCAIAVGLEGCGGKNGHGFTSTRLTDDMKPVVESILEELGPYPHTKVNLGGPGGPKKQTTRMLKATCAGKDVPLDEDDDSAGYEHVPCELGGDEDAYTIRMTKKWAELGMPTCPCGGEMILEEKDGE